MIARIKGLLTAVDDGAAYIDCGGLVYQVLVPLHSIAELTSRLQHGDIELDMLTVHYIEGGIGSGTMVPRLIGFLRREDRQFFQTFTSVRGMGVRKALRALSIPTAQVVQAIESGNTAVLKSLPEIGARTADRIIAELKGKVKDIAIETAVEPEPQPDENSEMIAQARDILMLRLQFSQAEAEEMVKSVLEKNRDISTVQDLLREAFQQQQQGVK